MNNSPLLKKIIDFLLNHILWWTIYLLAIYKAGLLFGVIIGVLAMFYGVYNYYKGCEFVEKLQEKYNL